MSKNIYSQFPEMVFIKGGTFQMGSIDGFLDEQPIHYVTVDDFYISKYLVTIYQFEKFVEETGYKTKSEIDGKGQIFDGNWRYEHGINWRHDVVGKLQTDKSHPVVRVSFDDAVAYCQWLSIKTGKEYSLPSEAQWEYAALGGNSYIYAGSDFIDEVAWYESNSDNRTHPVGLKKPNDYNLYDMSGNVNEWCIDYYSDYTTKLKNSKMQTICRNRVVRGGCWFDVPTYCRITSRNAYLPDVGYVFIGFRVCKKK